LKNKPEEKAKATNSEKKYLYASAMVAQKEHIATIEKRLKKYVPDFDLIAPFEKVNIRGASATAILYHNAPFN
jgi:hypothetical protein